MKRVIALLALVGSVAIVAAGCGGGGGSTPLSKAEYEQQMTTIGEHLTTALNSLGTATSAPKAATALKSLQTELRKAAGEMEAIAPPEKVKTEHAQLASGVRDFGDELDDVIEKLEAGNLQALASVTSLTAVTKIQDASTAINNKGFNIGSN